MRKHILNKHGDKIEEVKKEVSFFNNFLMDAKRPSLPELKLPPLPGPGPGEQSPLPPCLLTNAAGIGNLFSHPVHFKCTGINSLINSFIHVDL